ncbi:heavy metal-associated isoprenylated plant protein 2-like [Carex rostrata]
MSKRTEIKVDTSTPKAKRKVIKAIADLQGIDKIEVNSEKSTIAVTGNADPVDVVTRARKTAKWADIVSVGPPPKPEEKKNGDKKPEEKKEDGKNKEEQKKPLPNCMYAPVSYQRPVVVVNEYCQTGCSVM